MNLKLNSRPSEEQSNLQEQVKKCDEIIRTRPNEAQGYVGKAHYLIKLGRYDDALKPLDKAARLDPRDAEVHFRMGYCFSMLNRQKEALTAYNNSLQLKQTDQVCYNIANTLSLLGKYDDALRYYEHTLKINPKYQQAVVNRDNLLQTLSLRGKAPEKKPVEQPARSSQSPVKTVGRLPFGQFNKQPSSTETLPEQYELKKAISKIQAKQAVAEPPTPYDKQISTYSEIIMKDPSSLLAYCYRALFYLKANRSEHFETDIQWAIWVANYCENPGVTPFCRDFMKRFLSAYAESTNYLRELMVKPNFPNEIKQKMQNKVARYYIDVMNFVTEQHNAQTESQSGYGDIITSITTINNELRAMVETGIEQDKVMIPRLQALVQPAIDRFLKQVDTEVQLEYMQEINPPLFEYAVTMIKLTYNYLKSFDLIQTQLFQVKNPNANKLVEAAFQAITTGLSLAVTVSPEAEPLISFFKKFVDIKYNAKFRETLDKFGYLMKNILNEEKLNNTVVKAVLALARQPNKVEEVRAAYAGELIKERLNIKQKLSKMTESVSSMLQDVRDRVVEKLFNIHSPHKNPLRLLAVKDLTVFLQYVFTTDMDELPSLEHIIANELIDEAYVPKGVKLPTGPSVIMNLQTHHCLFSADEAGLGLYDSRIVIWRFVEIVPQEYLIMNLSSSRFLSANASGVYEADAGNDESKWHVEIAELEGNSRAWLIMPVSFTNYYLSFTESLESKLKFWETTHKPHIEWVDQGKLAPRHYWLTSLRNEL